MANKLDEKVLANALVLFALFVDITGWLWLGLLGQPSILNTLYPGFWQTPRLLLFGLVGSLIVAYVYGYAFAKIYNWVSARKGGLL